MPRVTRSTIDVPKALALEVERKALLKRLRAARDGRVIALLAPAGYGKTTLLAQLARKSSNTTAWVSLLADDADVNRFMVSLAEALERVLPSSFPSLQNALLQPVAQEAVIRALASDLARLSGGLNIVLDKAEVLGASVGDWLNDFVQRLPEGHQLWLAGYASAPLPVARWVAEGLATLISDRDLAFSPAESAALMRLSVNAKAVVVSESLEGWPAAVALMARSANTPGLAVKAQDLLGRSVERLPEALRVGVTELCACSVWDAGLPGRLGLQLPMGWLETLLETGLPLTRLADGHFMPHSLLLDALRVRLEQNPNRFKEAHRRAGLLSEAEGQPINGLSVFARGGCHEDAIRVLRFVLPDLIERFEYRLALELMGLVPEAVLPKDVRVLQGIAYLETGETLTGAEVLTQQMHGSGLEARAFVALSYQRYKIGDYEGQLQLVEEGTPFIRSDADTVRLGAMRCSALHALGRRDGQLERCLELRHIAERHGNPYLLANVLDYLAIEYGELSKNALCEETFRRELEILESVGADRLKLRVLFNFADLLLRWDRPSEAMALIETGTQIAGEETPFWRMAFSGFRGVFDYENADLESAATQLRICADLCTRHAYSGPAFQRWLWLSEVLSLSNQLEAALECLDRATHLLPADSAPNTARLHLSKAILAFASQEHIEAQMIFSSLVEDEYLINWDRLRCAAYLAQLALLSDSLTASHATSLIKKATEVGHHKPLLPDLKLVAPGLRTLVSRGWLELDIDTLWNSRASAGDPRPKLSIKALGGVRLEINSVPIQLRLKRCFELLVWLCVHDSGSREEIVTALWDGSRNRSHMDHFKVLIRNLRVDLMTQSKLAFNPITVESGQYKISSALRVNTDFSNTQEQQSITAPKERSSFMTGIYSNWVVDFRNALENRE